MVRMLIILLKTGGHHEFTVNGKYDVKAGEHIKSVTKVHGSDRVVFKGKAGTDSITY